MGLSKIGCCIYKITSPSSKVYIGQSRNIQNRVQNYKRLDCKKQPILYKSLSKYSWEAHTFEIIEECEFEQLNIKERYWQDFYDVLGENGLNCVLTKTDELPQKISEETINKMSERAKGRKQSEETLLKRSISMSGEKHPNFGKKRSKETIEKMAKASKGKKLSEEAIEKLLDINGTKLIDVITKQIYKSITKASKTTGIPYGLLQKALQEGAYNPTNIIKWSDFDETFEYLDKNYTHYSGLGHTILNEKTGEVFEGMTKAHKTTNYTFYSFRKMLLGEKENTTDFKIINKI